ncbi:YutD family protein [Levilactobacillus brevis]|uniref:YutD family protein n=1 Tax=Levilactobacillus brevis TaxID=1580 RepID=UPI001C1EDF3D|nr:YutD family protein [Levilactobacillus brevis]MBU7538934.1 YutD family protein [Levilactobacillus brevis]MBU7557851.1 YutD family protein [Levilactobacillus brevis]MBU7565107.1 YutD family protein [Levilactobacillus brevis]MCE6009588.1 YutD family protein [Levilactobacillus brevis]MCE6013218.1 YutD family protein [Levilactobacillus brevis]
MTTVDRKDLEALVAQQKETREPAAEVVRVDETHLTINNHPYELVVNVRDGFDFTEFAARFSTILSKFDYIVGDWGFEQLRLKGFYAEERSGAKQNQIEAVQDYLYEMCNFGCAYFILHNLDVKTAPKPRRNRRRRNTNGPKVEKTTATAAQPAVKADTAGDKPSHANNNHRRRSRHRRRNTPHPYTEERRTTATSTAAKTVTVATGGQGRRHFTIRKKEEE